jgi:hypothetical protein
MERITNKSGKRISQSINSALEFYLKNNDQKQRESDAQQATIFAKETDKKIKANHARERLRKMREKLLFLRKQGKLNKKTVAVPTNYPNPPGYSM